MFSDKEKLEIKVVDFGIAGYCHNNQGEMTDAGTVKYMPPEVLSRKDLQASRAMDIWAWGVILYALLFNKMPFSGNSKADLIKSIVKKPVSFPDPDKVTTNMNNSYKYIIITLLHFCSSIYNYLIYITYHLLLIGIGSVSSNERCS